MPTSTMAAAHREHVKANGLSARDQNHGVSAAVAAPLGHGALQYCKRARTYAKTAAWGGNSEVFKDERKR